MPHIIQLDDVALNLHVNFSASQPVVYANRNFGYLTTLSEP
jgi:hypothetical protein